MERDLAGIRDKVLYKNIMGDQGWNFYSRPDCGAWFMFANGKVMMIDRNINMLCLSVLGK